MPRNPSTSHSATRAAAPASIGALALAVALSFACARPAVAAPADPNAFIREAVFDGPTDLLWHLLTTEQGVESWLAPHAEVDLRVGGYVKTNQEADGKIGDPMTVVNRVVALTPGKSVAVRVDQTPQGYPLAGVVVGTWYEVSVDPVANGKSRIRCVGHGFPAGPAAYMIRPMFEKAADLVFDHLRAAVDREVLRAPVAAPVPTLRSTSPSAPAKPAKAPQKATPKRPR